jgi:hypothetical protein
MGEEKSGTAGHALQYIIHFNNKKPDRGRSCPGFESGSPHSLLKYDCVSFKIKISACEASLLE